MIHSHWVAAGPHKFSLLFQFRYLYIYIFYILSMSLSNFFPSPENCGGDRYTLTGWLAGPHEHSFFIDLNSDIYFLYTLYPSNFSSTLFTSPLSSLCPQVERFLSFRPRSLTTPKTAAVMIHSHWVVGGPADHSFGLESK